MSLTPADHVARARLAIWQRRIQETADLLTPPQADDPAEILMLVLDQLAPVDQLSGGLVSDLRHSATSTFGQTRAGRKYLSQAATALLHSGCAVRRLSAVVNALTTLLEPAPRPDTAAAELALDVQLGHAAAVRSLHRAARAVAPAAGSDVLPPVSAIEHGRTTEPPPTQSTRRRP
ncbi:hypothetical protein [Streptomyces sp. NPDC005004]